MIKRSTAQSCLQEKWTHIPGSQLELFLKITVSYVKYCLFCLKLMQKSNLFLNLLKCVLVEEWYSFLFPNLKVKWTLQKDVVCLYSGLP